MALEFTHTELKIISELAERLYIEKLSGQYTVRGFQKEMLDQCIEEAENVHKRLREYRSREGKWKIYWYSH